MAPDELDIAAAVTAVFAARPGLPWLPARSLPSRGILHPIAADGLTEDQFEAISDAAVAEGDQHLYVSYVERFVDEAIPQDFVVDAYAFRHYMEVLPSALDHAVVSPQRAWGALVLHQGVALIAGSGAFMRVVYGRLLPLREQTVSFSAEMAASGSAALAAWADQLLTDLSAKS